MSGAPSQGANLAAAPPQEDGMTNYDAIVIGTGQAGPALARRLAGAGMKVAIVERGRFGGTCVNTGCTPTKTLVACAYAAHMARRGADYGFTIGGGGVTVDMKRVKARKDHVAGLSNRGVERSLKTLENSPSTRATRFSCRSTRSEVGTDVIVPTRSSSMSAAALRCPTSRARRGRLSHQQLDAGGRLPAAASLGDRRQLRRARVRARCIVASAARSRSWRSDHA